MAIPQIEPREFNDLLQEMRELNHERTIERFQGDKTAWADGYQFGYREALADLLAEMAGFDRTNERHFEMLKSSIEIAP